MGEASRVGLILSSPDVRKGRRGRISWLPLNDGVVLVLVVVVVVGILIEDDNEEVVNASPPPSDVCVDVGCDTMTISSSILYMGVVGCSSSCIFCVVL